MAQEDKKNKAAHEHRVRVQHILGIPMTSLDEKTQKFLEGLRAERQLRHAKRKQFKKGKQHGFQNRHNNPI